VRNGGFRVCTDFEEHKITRFLGKIVLQSDTSANATFGSKTGPAFKLEGIHGRGNGRERKRQSERNEKVRNIGRVKTPGIMVMVTEFLTI
jgi:hypothetical protein